MKKTTSILALLTFLLILTYGISFCEDIDLSGTWVGTTEVPDPPEPDKLTLVLEKTNGEYSGTISDSLGFAENEECEDIEFKDNTLSFNFTIYNGDEYMQVYATLTVDGDTMKGYWEMENGSSSSVELKRKE